MKTNNRHGPRGGNAMEWVAMFGAQALERIDRNAGRLAGLILEGKLPLLRTRQSIASARIDR